MSSRVEIIGERFGSEYLAEPGSVAQHHITSMFPAPLTSFAPTYMALNECGPRTECNVASGWKSLALRWLGHVGNI